MSRFRDVINKLQNIGSEEFAELCDMLLRRTEKDVKSFTRSGAVRGKPKPKKGIPDSYFLCSDNKFLFVEHTTQQNPFEKLKESIDKCFDLSKTKIKPELIKKIILCFNSEITPEQITILLQHTYKKNKFTILSFYNINDIADSINREHRDLAYEYLSLPLDRGQIISIENFIKQYDDAPRGIATTLTNEFLFREKETEEIKKALISNNLIIISGPAGVGKTKIALECLQRFLIENINFNAFCFSNKNCDLIDDLNHYIKSNKNYVLFIDDANRFDHLIQIIKFYEFHAKGKLKIIMTTRDYSFRKVEEVCSDISYKKIEIDGFNDAQIKGILESSSFNITNFEFQKPILTLANGNPRFAIMAAKLALKEQNVNSLYNIGGLFENYFKAFLEDNKEIFSNKTVLRTLGILAFLGATPYLQKEKIENTLHIFQIDYEDFIDSITELEKFELIQSQYGYVKIGEQNTSIYFFYRVFIKDKLLSFELLLQNYFKNYSDSIREVIIPIVNFFEFKNIQKEIVPALKSTLEKNKDDRDFVFKFLDFFWFYMPETVLEYVFNLLQTNPIIKNEIYNPYFENEYKKNAHDNTISLLSKLFDHYDYIYEALELSFEYIKRNPEKLPILLEKIKGYFSFNHEDERYGFEKQKRLFEFLLEVERVNAPVFVISFLALVNHFLKHSFRGHGFTIRNTMYLGTYNLKFNKYLKDIRTELWKNIYNFFPTYPSECLKIMLECSDPSPDINKDILKFDIPFIIKIFEKYLSASDFEHCYIVQENISWWERKRITNDMIKKLKGKFNNETYEIYKKLNWDPLEDKEYSQHRNYDKFEKNKKEEIRKSFKFNSFTDFENFYKKYQIISNSNIVKRINYYFDGALDNILDENFSNMENFGIKMIEFILKNDNKSGFFPYLTFTKNINSIAIKNKLWDILCKYNYKNKMNWKILFWTVVPKEYLEKKDLNELIDVFSKIDNTISYLSFTNLSNFIIFDKKILATLLNIVINKKKKERINIRLDSDFIEKNFELLSNNLTTLKETYILFNTPDAHFDYYGKNLALILNQDKMFLLEYVKFICDNYERKEIHSFHNLSIVWSVPQIEPILSKAFKIIDRNRDFYYLEHFANAFFQNLKNEYIEKADNFILDFIKIENKNSESVSMFMDVINESRKHLYEQAILIYLENNQSVDDFKKVKWMARERMYSGDIIINDSRASKWNNLLNIVNKSPHRMKLIPIKKYIKDKIESYRSEAEWEKERKFVNPNW